MDIIALKELELQIDKLSARHKQLISDNKALREQIVQLTLERNRLLVQKESAKNHIRSTIKQFKCKGSTNG